MHTSLKLVLTFLFLATLTSAQNCYYPNGDLAQGDGPCYTSDGTCCPYQWQCLSNGLCYLDNENYFGRYTCTDQSWQSSNCPNYCTDGGSASGNEALLQCADGSWCCDGDRSFNCCTTTGTDFFSLPQGSPISLILSVPSATPVVSSAPSQPQTSTSAPASTPSSSSSTDDTFSTTTSSSMSSSGQEPSMSTTVEIAQTSPAPQASHTSSSPVSTLTSSAVTTGTNGEVSTVVVVSTIAAAGITGTAANTLNSKGGSDLGMIIGLAVGIPVFIILAAVLAFLVWKHRKSRQASQTSGGDEYSSMADKFGYQVGHVPPDGRAPEIDSFPVATGRTKSNRRSELDGSSSSRHSPAVSSVTTGNGPYQGYSPITPTVHTVLEEPAELWGGYVPYRPRRNEIPEKDEKHEINDTGC